MILKEKHIIDRSYFSKISGQIGHYNKLGISVTHDHKAAEMLHLKYQEWISAFYDDTVSVNYNNLPDHIKF
ncbi:MAG: hypothetical protein IPO32_13155 [Crocinitomicaceae bacterium]|nr:hypothetical protein [Crocinitomicaceae bacterium]